MMGRTESWDIPSKLDVEKNAQKDKIRETIDKVSESKILFEITVRVKINSNFSSSGLEFFRSCFFHMLYLRFFSGQLFGLYLINKNT